MDYKEFLQHLKRLPPKDQAVELFLRKFFTDNGLAFNSLDTNPGPLPDPIPEGETYWSERYHTPITGLPYGSSLVHGQEMLEPVYNDTGAPVTNGQVVFFDTPTGPDDHLDVGLTRPDLFARIGGMITTESIADGAEGWVATYGVVSSIPLNGIAPGVPVFADPTVPGGYTAVEPSYPDHIIFLGGFIRDNGDGTGDFRIDPYIVQREVPTPVTLTYNSPAPARNTTENVHGGLTSLATGHDLSAGPLTLSAQSGIGKLIIVVNSAAPDCDITVQGTAVDRNTGLETAAQSSVMTVDTQTTDGSGVDVNGATFNDFQNAYITDRWYTGIPLGGAEDIVITGAGTTVPTDIDVYQVSFEQFNDARYIELDTADMTYFTAANPQGDISAYIYTIEVTDDKVNLTKQGEHLRTAAQHVANTMYRIRRGNMGIILDGRTDGVYLTIRMTGTDKFTDVGIKVWGNVLY